MTADAEFSPPTTEEARAILDALGLSRAEAGALVASPPRTVHHWRTDRAMSFPALYTLVHRARGVEVTPAGWRRELAPLLEAARSAS